MNNENQDRIRITEATVVLTDKNKNEDVYKITSKYLRGSILETVFRDFINTLRRESMIDSGMIVAGNSYSITVEVKEVINIDTLDRIRVNETD